jgi:hypothetical protein
MSIAYTRARFERQLTDTCVISTPAGYTSDGKGGRIPTPGGSATYACSLLPLNGQLSRGDVQVERGSYRLRLPWSAVVGVANSIVLLGHTYTVRWAPPAEAAAFSRIIGMDEAK